MTFSETRFQVRGIHVFDTRVCDVAIGMMVRIPAVLKWIVNKFFFCERMIVEE